MTNVTQKIAEIEVPQSKVSFQHFSRVSSYHISQKNDRQHLLHGHKSLYSRGCRVFLASIPLVLPVQSSHVSGSQVDLEMRVVRQNQRRRPSSLAKPHRLIQDCLLHLP